MTAERSSTVNAELADADLKQLEAENAATAKALARRAGNADVPVRQWPDNICTGQIRYGTAQNFDGFYLADVMHGIPTFGSVSDASPPTIRGQHVRVFNYPGQTEEIAKQLVHRWNSHDALVKALEIILNDTHGIPDWEALEQCRTLARAALSQVQP